MINKGNNQMFTIIYCETKMLISKRMYPNWQAVAKQFVDYKANLSPDTLENIVEYLDFDYPNFLSDTGCTWREVMENFASSSKNEFVCWNGRDWLSCAP